MGVALFLIGLAIVFVVVSLLWTALKWAIAIAVILFVVGVITGLLKRARPGGPRR